MATFRENDPAFSTKAIHAGQEPEQWSSLAVIPPISLSTTFKQEAPAEIKKYEYGRTANPTRDVLETCMASLDGAKHCLTFCSGMAACTAITHLLSAGDHIVSMDDMYGGTYRYFTKVASRMNIQTTLVDATDPAKLDAAIRPNTKMVWLETPSNPTLKIVDIRACADVVAKHKKDKNLFMVVDNTFLSSYFQRPLELGADVSYYSCTKYMNGHSDVIMGAACINDDDLHNRLRFLQNAIGPVPSPFDCYLVNRSLKTLKVRMEEHQRNSLALGKFLEKHPAVLKVIHPGLPSHPQHELVKRQNYGHSGMVSFYIKGGLDQSRKFLSSLKMVTLAESLGGYESLAELPYLMTHASVEEKDRVAVGVTENLIRVSAGLEGADDIIADISQALEASQH
eukprot:GFUD01016313.1.p1 GENE.GFUD01016313.1~~GFUD01016313.1.p1  ORF type:complete len:396 (+),score=120.61 GFUD01016313.1:61-1248(+)